MSGTSSPSQIHEIAFDAFGVRASVGAADARLLAQVRDLVPPHSQRCDAAAVKHRFTLTQTGAQRFSVRHMVEEEAVEDEAPDRAEGDGHRLDDGDAAIAAARTEADRQRQELLTYLASDVDLDLALGVLYDHLHGTIALHAPEHLFIRAGVVGHAGGALVIPGRGLTGKTTLVTELVRAGATYYSDEFAVIDEHGLVHPYPSPPYLDAPGAGDREGGEEDGEPIRAQKPLPIEAVVVTSYRPGAVWRPRRLSPGERMLALMSQAVPAQERPAQSMRAVKRALARDPLTIASDRDEAASVAPALLAEPERELPRSA